MRNFYDTLQNRSSSFEGYLIIAVIRMDQPFSRTSNMRRPSGDKTRFGTTTFPYFHLDVIDIINTSSEVDFNCNCNSRSTNELVSSATERQVSKFRLQATPEKHTIHDYRSSLTHLYHLATGRITGLINGIKTKPLSSSGSTVFADGRSKNVGQQYQGVPAVEMKRCLRLS